MNLKGIMPDTVITSSYDKREDERVHSYNRSVSVRKNNRRNTKARITQYITALDDSIFPPVIYRKCIKHLQKNPPTKILSPRETSHKGQIKNGFYITQNGKRFRISGEA